MLSGWKLAVEQDRKTCIWTRNRCGLRFRAGNNRAIVRIERIL